MIFINGIGTTHLKEKGKFRVQGEDFTSLKVAKAYYDSVKEDKTFWNTEVRPWELLESHVKERKINK